MTEERKTPKLRFPDFTDPWELRRLNDCCGQLSATLNPQDTPDTVFNEYSMPAFDNGETPDAVTGKSMNSARKIIDRPCLLINKLNVRKKRIWNIKKPEKNAVSSTEFVPVYSNDIDLSFLKYSVLRDPFTSYLEDCSSGSSNSQKRVTPEVIMTAVLAIPSKKEQIKIGSLLENYDALITLYERKCEDAKTLKKAMLQKMFPKEGETIPEIRFPGFTGPWGQRRLGDVFKEYSDKGHPELPALTILQGGGTVLRDESDRKLQYDKANLSNYKKVNTGDFIVHLRSFEGGLEIATNTGVISPAYHTFHGENTDSQFFYSYFRSKKFIDSDLKPHVYGIRDGRSIDIEGMKTIKIPFPPYKEQVKIGDFINSINSAIVLYQRKCDELTEMKKGLLQQMFV